MKTYPIVLYVSKSRAMIALERKRYYSHTLATGHKGIGYVLAISLIFILGLSPLLFNFVVDPYNMNKVFNLGINKEKISLKAHYPLWKILNYPSQTATTLIMGDSRALALKDKYWHQLKLINAYNFSYGGGTINEIVDTVNFIKNSPQLKTIFIGIQLRSFSPLFKKGMNRVPEAIEFANNPLQYYSNGFVTEISWRQIESGFKDQIDNITANSNFKLISSAYAEENFDFSKNSLSKLLDPAHCTNCILPKLIKSQPAPSITFIKTQAVVGLGIWQELWPLIAMNRQLPKKFSNQIVKNAKSDWQSFTFSKKYWQGLVEISQWSKQHNIKLVFFIPPTIAEMQQQISNYGYGQLNQELRTDLARLATVVDFDFDSPLTRNVENFNDAYHFNFKIAKAIIGELIQLVSDNTTSVELSQKRRSGIRCPITKQDITKQLSHQGLRMIEGKSCRIWQSSDE